MVSNNFYKNCFGKPLIVIYLGLLVSQKSKALKHMSVLQRKVTKPHCFHCKLFILFRFLIKHNTQIQFKRYNDVKHERKTDEILADYIGYKFPNNFDIFQ